MSGNALGRFKNIGMTDAGAPFNGLFQVHTLGARRSDGWLRWDFPARDLNRSASQLFHHLDQVFEILKAHEFAFLSTIELDAEAGRFPDVLAQYFREGWAGSQSFFVAPIESTPTASGYAVGRLTFEAVPGQMLRVLGQNGGFRWGSALRVWGLQVPRGHIADAIRMSTDDAGQLSEVQKIARAAWLAADDLDALALWISPSVGADALKTLARMRTA